MILDEPLKDFLRQVAGAKITKRYAAVEHCQLDGVDIIALMAIPLEDTPRYLALVTEDVRGFDSFKVHIPGTRPCMLVSQQCAAYRYLLAKRLEAGI